MDTSEKIVPLLGSKHGGKMPLWSCVLSFVNTMLGTGLLGMPWAVAHSGPAIGLSLLAIAAVVSMTTLVMLATAVMRFPGSSFSGLLDRSSLPCLPASFPDIIILFMCILGGQASYLIVIGDAMHTAIFFFVHGAPWWLSSRQLWICLVAVPLVPLCLQRKLHDLRLASCVAVFATLAVAMAVIVRAVTAAPADEELTMIAKVPHIVSWIEAMRVAPIFVFGFTCHQQMPPLALELHRCNFTRLASSAVIAVGIVSLVYGVVGVAGYISFGPQVAGNVLLNLRGSADGALASAALAVSLTMSIPLWTHAGRDAAARLFFKQSATCLPHTRFYTLTILMLLPSFAVACILEDLGIALSIVGGTGCSVVTLVLPALFYLRLCSRSSSNTHVMSAAAILVLALGTALIVRTVFWNQ